VKFGNDLNAYTSFDETVYFLPIPLDDPENLEKGLDIMEDWAFNATLDHEEIDKERGVVLEEYRLGLGAGKRMRQQYFDKLVYNSRYADRLPIGKKEILENFDYQALKDFYNTWYRPDLMAFIAVGDIDVKEMEKKIKKRFSKYDNPKNPKPRKEYDIPLHDETFVAIATDHEATSQRVSLYYKNPKERKPVTTVNGLRRSLVNNLFTTMINNRFQEISNSSNPPFSYGFSYYSSMPNNKDMAYVAVASPTDNDQLVALDVLVKENQRVKKHGFTASELDRARKEILNNAEKSYKERNKSRSGRYVSQLQNQFLNGNTSFSEEFKYEKYQELLPEISLEEVNKLIDNFIRKESRVAILTGPEYEDGEKKPAKEDVLNIINKDYKDLKPYQDEAMAESLVRKELEAGSITSETTNEELGTTTLRLSNGATVTYKKTDFKDDEVLMRAVSYGGTNTSDAEIYKKTHWAFGGLEEAGFSGLDKNDIQKFMSDKNANVNLSISERFEALSGNASPEDMKYLFQMIQAKFTDLNYNKEAFEGYKSKRMAFMGNLLASPRFYYLSEMYGFMLEDSPRWDGVIPDEEKWKNTSYKKAYDVYKQRFANAADFHFYFVGNIDEEKLKELSKQYIAALPSNPDKSEDIIDTGFRPKKGDFFKKFYKGEDPKSQVTIMYYGETEYDEEESMAIKALGSESGVYGVGANGGMSKEPYGDYNFRIQFPCGPENYEDLIDDALAELNNIRENGPTEEDLAKFNESALKDYDENIKKNDYWIRQMRSAYLSKKSPEEILEYDEEVKAVTAEQIQQVANKYISGDKYIAVLLPETAKEEE
jgi:zinc protease